MHRAFRSSWGFPRSEAHAFHVGGCGTEGSWRGARAFSFEVGEDGEIGIGVGGGAFGVRRPLRFLAHKLGLDEDQIKQLAQILDELKTERAQAAVDSRRTLASFADAVTGEAFDEAKAAAGAGLRVEGAERLKKAVLDALRRIHAVLRADQREQLAYLIRTGRLAL